MSFFDGLLQGFSQSQHEAIQEERQRADATSAKESQVYQLLMQSDDPEIQKLALTGLLESASPKQRKGGLRGWLGQMEESPTMAAMHRLIGSPVTEQKQTLPSRTLTPPASSAIQPQVLTQANPQAPMAQPDGAMIDPDVQAGGPPVQPTTPPPSLQFSTQPPQPYTMQSPRQVFLTPLQRLREQSAVRAGEPAMERTALGEAAFQAERANGATQAQSHAARMRMILGASARTSVREGNVRQNEQGEWVQDLYDSSTGEVVKTIPAIDPAKAKASSSQNYRYGINREAIAKELFGKNYGDLTQAESSIVMREDKSRIEAESHARGTGTNQAVMERPADFTTARESGVGVGTTPNQVLGQQVPTERQRERRASVLVVKTELEDIRKNLLGPLPKQGELAGKVPGFIYGLRRRTDTYRVPIAQLESAVNNVLASLSRSVNDNRGSTTENDLIRAEATITNLRDQLIDAANGDTQESAGARIDETLIHLGRVLEQLPDVPTPSGPPPRVGAQGGQQQDRPSANPLANYVVGPDGELYIIGPDGKRTPYAAGAGR